MGRFEVGVGSMQDRCKVDVDSIWSRCGVDVRSMWIRFEVDVVWMWGRCGFDLKSMWCGCEVDAFDIFVQHKSASTLVSLSCERFHPCKRELPILWKKIMIFDYTKMNTVQIGTMMATSVLRHRNSVTMKKPRWKRGDTRVLWRWDQWTWENDSESIITAENSSEEEIYPWTTLIEMIV